MPALDTITKVSLGYYLFQDVGKPIKTAIPVWAFRTESDERTRTFYVNAITGAMLDSRQHVAAAMEQLRDDKVQP